MSEAEYTPENDTNPRLMESSCLSDIGIDPFIFYDESDLAELLGISSSALAKGRKSKALRFVRPGTSFLYFGLWVLQWLESLSENKDAGYDVTPLITGKRYQEEVAPPSQ